MRNPIQLTTAAFGIMMQNPRLFAGIVLVPAILAFISAYLMPTPAEQVTGMGPSGLSSIVLLISFVVNIFMSIALILVMPNMNLSAMDSYKQSVPYFFRYLGMSILTMIILAVGFILLVVPGIIFSVWFLFAAFVLVLENTGMVASLKQSRAYVRGRWWGVFGRMIVMLVVLIILSVILSIVLEVIPSYMISNALTSALTMFLAPFTVAYMYLMYQDVKVSAPAPTV